MYIQYLLNKDLDLVKYNSCISSSLNTMVYAYSWYLNCVTDDWDALILNDYEAVMPLPKKKKYGIHYIYQPPWVQQLGIFSKLEIDETIVKKFIANIPKKFFLVNYFFNFKNIFSNNYVKTRNNYILSLNSDFETIKSSYNKNRKRISNKNFKGFNLNKKGNKSEYLKFYKSKNFDFKTHKDSFEKLQNLLNLNNEFVNVWTVYHNHNLFGGLVWIREKYRITYLVPLASDEAKKYNISTYLVNELIKEHQNTDLILDFEGSMIDGIAQFYKSFGAVKEDYYWYKKRLI